MIHDLSFQRTLLGRLGQRFYLVQPSSSERAYWPRHKFEYYKWVYGPISIVIWSVKNEIFIYRENHPYYAALGPEIEVKRINLANPDCFNLIDQALSRFIVDG